MNFEIVFGVILPTSENKQANKNPQIFLSEDL